MAAISGDFGTVQFFRDVEKGTKLYTAPPASQEQAQQPDDQDATVADYQEALRSVDALVRRLDIAINGDKASPQARLCDIVAQVEQAQQPMCKCGDRPASQCDEEWGPKCDLGNNPKHVKVVPVQQPGRADLEAAAKVCDGFAAPDMAAALRGQQPSGGEVVAWTESKPKKPGVYGWRGSPASYDMVHVHTRPTEHSPGGQLNGSCLSGKGFYHGCAITSWGGEWIGPLDTLTLATPKPEPMTSDPVAEVPNAMKIVTAALLSDPEYAWAWHCNIAMAAHDEGVGHYAANKAAARFLSILAPGLDTSKHLGFPSKPEITESPEPMTWQPIETAPDNTGGIVVVRWLDGEGNEQHDLDYTEDGTWSHWHDRAEHVEIIGGHGVSYTPPYQHWMPLPPAPVTKGEA